MRKGTNGNLVMMILCAVVMMSIIWPACGSPPARLDKPNGNSDTTAPTSTPAVGFEGEYPPPAFLPGAYKMSSANSNELTQVLDDGSAAASSRQTNLYEYRLDLTAAGDGGFVCRYTFTRVSLSYDINDEPQYSIDTDSLSDHTAETAMFYELIGQSFTAYVDANLQVVSVAGVDEILAAYPATAEIIGGVDFTDMARDLFYPLPSPLTAGTSWQLSQGGAPVTYAMSGIRGDMLGASVTGSTTALPDPVYDETQDFYQECTEALPVSGMLWINRNNRMIQELTSFQSSRGIFKSGGNPGVYEIKASSVCTITAC